MLNEQKRTSSKVDTVSEEMSSFHLHCHITRRGLHWGPQSWHREGLEMRFRLVGLNIGWRCYPTKVLAVVWETIPMKVIVRLWSTFASQASRTLFVLENVACVIRS